MLYSQCDHVSLCCSNWIHRILFWCTIRKSMQVRKMFNCDDTCFYHALFDSKDVRGREGEQTWTCIVWFGWWGEEAFIAWCGLRGEENEVAKAWLLWPELMCISAKIKACTMWEWRSLRHVVNRGLLGSWSIYRYCFELNKGF